MKEIEVFPLVSAIRVCSETGSQVDYHKDAQEYRHADGTRCDHRFDYVEEAAP